MRATPLFPQAKAEDRFKAREEFVLKKTEENSRALGRDDLSGKAFKVGYYDMAYLQILWSANEVRRLPSPLGQFPETSEEAAKVERGRELFTKKVEEGGSGCADRRRGRNNLPTEVPITVADSTGALAGDGFGPVMVSLDSPVVVRNGRAQIDRLGTSNLAPLVAGGQINPQLAASGVRVIKDTHGKTSHLSEADIEALEAYLMSLSLSKPLNSSSGLGGTPTTDAVAQFVAPEVKVAESAGSVTLEVTRTGDTMKEAEVEYQIADFTASERSDYTISRGRLRFAPGETRKTLTVLLTDDASVEQDEQLSVSLVNPSSGCKLGEAASAMVTVVDNDTAPSGTNPADDAAFFVRQHYLDFFSREPDADGLAYWTNVIKSCGSDAQCVEVTRINVSAAFFLSIEFKETGYFVNRLFKASYGRRLSLLEFMPDTQEASRGLIVNAPGWQDKLESNKRAFLDAWVARPAFRQVFDPLTNEQFVDKLFANAGVTPERSERDRLVQDLNGGRATRSAALRRVVENAEFERRELNPAFVLMQYFGYLRRDPDDSGYNHWLTNLEKFNGNFIQAELVKAFIQSIEYNQRFTPSN